MLPGLIDSLGHPQARADMIPMKRIGTVVEAAKALVILLSHDSSYVTARSLRVDGGLARHL